MEGDGTSGHEPELTMEQKLDSALEKIAEQDRRIAKLEGDQKKIADGIEADQKARVFEAFQAKLKPGHQEKATELFEAYQKDPASWVLENADKFVQPRQERRLQGSPITEGGQAFDLDAEREKKRAEGKVI